MGRFIWGTLAIFGTIGMICAALKHGLASNEFGIEWAGAAASYAVYRIESADTTES